MSIQHSSSQLHLLKPYRPKHFGSMQAYLAERYMSGPKADAILSRVAPEKKKKKRKTATTISTIAGPSGVNLVVDDDSGWGNEGQAMDEDVDDVSEAVVASDRSFKKRRVADNGEESSGWTTVRDGLKREDEVEDVDRLSSGE